MGWLAPDNSAIKTSATSMSDEDGSKSGVQKTSQGVSGDCNGGHSSSESKLRSIVEKQRREIFYLRKHLAVLGLNPDASREWLVSAAPKAVEDDVCKASNSTPQTANIALENSSGMADDISVELAFPALLKGFTGRDEVLHVTRLCQNVLGNGIHGDWKALLKSFFEEIIAAKDSMPSEVAVLETSLPHDWYKEPWYLLYVQNTGVPSHVDDVESDFDDLRKMLPYIRDKLGFSNICLLPHYESPMADGGRDISAFETRKSLGGEKGFARFMKDALAMGLRVATDAVFNHTSTKHEWFQRALKGEAKYLAYYIQRNGREKIAEWETDGNIICRYCDPDGTITERSVVFPDIDRTHGLWVEIDGKMYQFYRTFFPFQVDLNLQTPDVLTEVFRILGRELKQGVLGKRMDAVAHWVKRAGTSGESLPENHALQALLKSFVRHVNSRAIILPEVVGRMASVAEYAGTATTVNGEVCTSEGDALSSFEMQAALREATFFQTTAPYWRATFRTPPLPNGCTWINLLEDHNESYMSFFERDTRVWLAEYIKTHNGFVYKNGLSAGGRIADCLNNDPRRIATALFLLYITPGTPLVYAGTEIGARSDRRHAEKMMRRSHEVYRRLGVYADINSCYDARELQRGRLSRGMFDRVIKQGYEGMAMVCRMNELWMECRWLREGKAKPIDSGDVCVLCMGLLTDDGSERVICMVNLVDRERWAVVTVKQAGVHWAVQVCKEATQKMSFVDILTGRRMEVVREPLALKFRLTAFDRAAVTVVPMTE